MIRRISNYSTKAHASPSKPTQSTQSRYTRMKKYIKTDPLKWNEMLLGQKVIHGIKSISYLTFICFGASVVGYALYSVVGSMNEQSQAWNTFEDCVEITRNDERIQYNLGLPLNASAQDSTDTRIKNTLVYSNVQEATGNRLFLQFVIKGSRRTGYVYVEKFKKSNESDYKYEIIVVEIPSTGQRIVIMDNRELLPKQGFFGFNRKRIA